MLLDCGHDQLADYDSPELLLHNLWKQKAGSCETALAMLAEQIEARLSDFRLLVVRRHPEEALISFLDSVPWDLAVERCREIFWQTDAGLDRLALRKEALVLSWTDWDDRSAAEVAWKHLREEEPFPAERYEKLRRLNVTVDYDRWITPEIRERAAKLWGES